MHNDPKQGERIQADCDAKVVDDSDPKITGGEPDVALLEGIGSFKDDSNQSKYRLQPRVL